MLQYLACVQSMYHCYFLQSFEQSLRNLYKKNIQPRFYPMSILNRADITSKIQDVFCKANIYYSVLVYNNNIITEKDIQALCDDLRVQDIPLYIIDESYSEIQEHEVANIATQYRMFVIPQNMFGSWVTMQGWNKLIEDVSIIFCLPCDISYDVQKTTKTSDNLCLIPL